MKEKNKDQMKKFFDAFENIVTAVFWQLNGAWMLSAWLLLWYGQKYIDMRDGPGGGYLPFNGVIVSIEHYPKEHFLSAFLGVLVAMFIWVIMAAVGNLLSFFAIKIFRRIKGAKAGKHD